MFRTNRLHKLPSLLAVLGLLLAACNSSQAPKPTTAAPTSVPIVKPTSAPPATVSPTAVPATTKSATFNQFSFDYDLSLATDVTATLVPGMTDPSAPEFMIHPDTTQFNLVGYQSINRYLYPRIEIYPVAEYEQISEYAKGLIAQLKAMLANQSATSTQVIPFLPVENAAQVLRTQIQYLKFNGGQGVRFVTQLDQAPIPINNLEIIYTFQGLTADGKYYISAILPVTTGSLLNSDEVSAGQYQAFNDNFQQYLQETVKKLDAQKPSDFAPDLSLLDALIESLRVK